MGTSSESLTARLLFPVVEQSYQWVALVLLGPSFLGNLAFAHVRQREIDQAATVLHRAIDLLEVSRGGAA
jgi:hypothetical protein